MIARSVNAAADVIHRAQVNGAQTAAGIAIALESAQLLMSPETVHEMAAVEAERDRLKARVVELEQLLADAPIAVTLTEKAGAAADKLTRLLAPTQAFREDGVYPQGTAQRVHQRAAVEDPNGLHHEYRLGRDLPAAGER